MNTPIYDFVKNYAKSRPVRLHMPGHKGAGALGVEELDITEIKGADSLYEADGIIAQSEQNAANLFGTKATFYSTEGSSQCIRSILWLTKQYASQRGKKAVITAFRNTHKTFVTASALLDIEVDYLHPKADANYLSCPVGTEELTAHLDSLGEYPTALYLTSPDYLGNVADIGGVARVCHDRNILLLVDNAHGAYLKFLPESRHPMDLGADLSCDSAHKTLPVLTGGAYLHIAQNADDFFVQNARNALSLFGSTSPSYLILQSLDLANRYIANGYRERLVEWGKAICAMQTRLTEKGYRFLQNEPLKLTVDAKAYGYRGDEMAEFLRDKGIEVEFSDPDVLVMMFTPELTKEDLFVTENALLSLEKREKLTNSPPKYHRPERALAAWEAISAPAEQVSAGDAVGRILACPTVGCPPAVPILTCGERIDEDAIALARYYGIESFKVVKE